MSGERTESATPRRLEKLRDQGNVARSQELAASIGLLTGCVVLQIAGGSASTRLVSLLVGDLSQLGHVQDTDALWAQQALSQGAQVWLFTVAPLLVVLPLLGVGVNFAQAFVFTPKPLFRPSALNPLQGAKRFVSMQALAQLVRSLVKISLVSLLTWRALDQTARQLPSIDGSTNPQAMAAFIAQAMLNVSLPAGEVLLVFAVADYLYQRWNFNRGARMSKQEVKEEHKEQEGDPLVKGQIRARQRKMALQRRQLLDVPAASVVVTNPTHIAVALKYDRGMASPRVVAMGADLIAQRIKEIAREAGVPCVENVPLARGLYASVDVGDDIPVELYQAVAEVLAYVYSLKARRRRHYGYRP